MDIGKLRERVTIQEPNLVDNGRGGRMAAPGEDKWRDVATVWAEVLALRGGEALTNGIQRGTQIWRVTIWMRSGVSPANRLRWVKNGIDMNVRTAAPNEEGDGLVMTAKSGTAA